jgi:excisionase family DNA binding protein
MLRAVNNSIPAEEARTPGLLTKREAAQFLGVAERTLDQWMKRRLIPYLKLGVAVRFDRDDLREHLVTACRVGAIGSPRTLGTPQ